MTSISDCKLKPLLNFSWSCMTGETVRIMITMPGTIRSLKFSKQGNHLISGNDHGQIVVFDVAKGIPIDVIDTCQIKAVWSLDVSWDDQIMAAGTEDGTIELYNFNKIIS